MRKYTVIIPQSGEYVNKGSGEGLQFTEIVICWWKYPGGCPMKKYIAVMLTLVLLSNLVIIGLLFQNNRLLQQRPDPVSVRVTEEAPESQNAPTPQSSEDEKILVQVAEEKYLEPDGVWRFEFAIENTTSTNLYIRSLTFLDNGENMDKRMVEHDPMLFEMMMGPNPGEVPLKPGEVMRWGDGHPGEYLVTRTYRFEFLGEDGIRYIAEYAYDLRMETKEGKVPREMDHSGDLGQDLLTLRHEADFEISVAKDVFWVPVNILGKSGYTNAEIFQMTSETPETRQREIHTLYEALQLYQVGSFAASDDNVRMRENGIDWEHHKPGFYAVATNNGCCATSANWLNYILAGDYEEVGFVATSQRDGNGHIYNYLYQDGWYYFIDLTHYRTDWIATAVEDGNLDSYYGSDFILGNCHKAASVQAFVDYVQANFNDPPGLMFRYTAADCLALDSRRSGEVTTIVYEDDPQVQLHVIFDDPDDKLHFEQVAPPRNRPEWG